MKSWGVIMMKPKVYTAPVKLERILFDRFDRHSKQKLQIFFLIFFSLPTVPTLMCFVYKRINCVGDYQWIPLTIYLHSLLECQLCTELAVLEMVEEKKPKKLIEKKKIFVFLLFELLL